MEFEPFLYRSGQETGGQDDLVWYTANRQANGTYTVNVKAADHKNSTGLYNVHLYYVQNNGQMTGVGGTTTTVAIGKKNQTPVSADLTIAKSEKTVPSPLQLRTFKVSMVIKK